MVVTVKSERSYEIDIWICHMMENLYALARTGELSVILATVVLAQACLNISS